MSRLIERLKAEKNDPRTSAEITYDIGQQLESAGNKDVFTQNPDFYKEYLDLKDELRRPMGGELWDAFSASARDSLPEAGLNAGAAIYSGIRAAGNAVVGADKFQGDSVTDFLHRKAQQERDEYEVHRGEVSVPGIEQVNDVGDALRFGLTATAESVPQMAPMAAGGIGAAARGLGALGRIGVAAAPAVLQQTGEIYGNIPDEAKATGDAAMAALGGGVVAGALDLGGLLGGPVGRLIRKAGAPQRSMVESFLSKVGLDGVYGYGRNILERGGLKGAAANFAQGVAFEGPTELAQEAISIAAEEYASGQQLPEDVIASRLKNAAAAGAFAGGVIGGAVGLKGQRQATQEVPAEELAAFEGTVLPPAGPMEFGDFPPTAAESAIFNEVQEPKPPMEFGTEPLTPEEQQALYGVTPPAGPMEFQTDDEIDLESLTEQALNAAKGAAKLSTPVQREVDFEADTYMQPRTQRPANLPTLEGAAPNLPDKYDITKPLLGPGNELYAADAPSVLDFQSGLSEAARFPDTIRTPEEVAAEINAYQGAKRSTQREFPSKVRPSSLSELADQLQQANETVSQSKEIKAQPEIEPAIPLAPTISADARIEGGAPLLGRIYMPEDGGINAKIETAAVGGVSAPHQRGSHKAVALLDRATGQVLVRDIKKAKAIIEGKRVADIMIGGMQLVRQKKPKIDPVYGSMAAPWTRISQELHRGMPRFDVVGEFYFDEPRAGVNFNFANISDFESHGQVSEALSNYQTRGAYAAPEVAERIAKIFPRDRENFATRSDIEKVKDDFFAKKRQFDYYKLLIAHKHKLTGEELTEAKSTLDVKQYATVEAESKNVKLSRKKQATGGGGDVNLQQAQHDTEDVSVVANMADTQAPVPSEEAKFEGEIESSTRNVPENLLKLHQLIKSGADPEVINRLAYRITLGGAKISMPKSTPAQREAFAKAFVPTLIKQIETKGTSLQFSQRSSTSWLLGASQAREHLEMFIRAMVAANADVVGIQTDIDSSYDALSKKYGFILDDPKRGRPVVGLVADWLTSKKVDSNLVLNAAHEAAHLFLDKSGSISEEQRRAFQAAIAEMPWGSQNYLVGPFVTDLRILANTPRQYLNAPQLAILEGATLGEIQEAVSIPPEELLTERAVEHLALFGVAHETSRDIFSQVIRFIKDLAYQIGIAVQKMLKNGDANQNLLRAFVENRWLQFINRDFAASNTSIALSLRDWIGAPTTAAERIPVYSNLDGDPTNTVYNPKTGDVETLQVASDDVSAVQDRIKRALDRYNAEKGILPETAQLKALEQERAAILASMDKMEQTPQNIPAIQAAAYRISKLTVAIETLGHYADDAARVMRRAISDGERIQFSQRNNAGEALGMEGPEIEANTTLASINLEIEMFRNLHSHPDVARYLPAGTTMEEFLEDYVQLTPTQDPSKKKAAAIETISQGRDAYGQPFNHNPNATIASLPESVNGSSAQQAALRDSLIKLNQTRNMVLKRAEQARERKEELDDRKDNLTAREKLELEKINARLPMLDRIQVLKDVGLDDQIARLEGKIGKAMLWDATPGASYFVPPSEDSDETAVRNTTAQIPTSLSFDNASRQAFYQNVRKQSAWLANEENRNRGSVYGEVQIQNRKLLTLSAEPIYTAQTWRLRNTYFDSLRNMLRGVGTPLAKFVGGRFDKLDAILLRWGNARQITGTKWSRAYDDFKKAVNWKASDEDFRRTYWNRIVSYAEDVPDGTTDPAGAVIRAMTELSKFKMSADAKSKLRTLLRETVANNAQEAEILRSENLKVEDSGLGDKAQRDVIRQGFITGRRSISEQLDRIYQEMRPVWSATEGDPLFENMAENYQENPDGVKVQSTTYFTPTVVSAFVKPFIYHNRQYFKAPGSEGAVVRMASLANVRDAFERSGGNMVDFAVILNQLEGGSKGNEAQFVADTLKVFKGFYGKFQTIANQRKKAQDSGVETLPRQIMDAREASDFPPEFVNYATYDASANRTLLFQLALNSSFGRNGLSSGEFAKNVDQIVEELKALHIQLSNLVEVEGKSKEEAKKIMGDEKYHIALQAPDHLKLVNRLTEKIAMVTRSSGSLMADIRIADELLGLNANMNLQSPRSALINTLDMLAPLYRTKLSATSFAAVKNSIASFGKDFFGSLFESVNIHMFQQSETQVRMKELGLSDPELYVSWRDKLADFGPGNALDTPSGVETLGQKSRRKSLLFVRRARQLTNLGVADIADLATLKKFGFSANALTPGDKNIAPKFRVLGIFNMVGQSLANAAVNGQYQNFKDLVTRGVDFIKNSSNPDVVVANLLDGKKKLSNQDLGYTKKWMILNDQAAFDYMNNAISEKMDEGSIERIVADAYMRMRNDPKAKVITDTQFVRVANLALTEFQLNANFANAPIDLKTNSLWRLLSPYLTWPYLAMLRVPDLFKSAEGQWKMKSAMDGAAVSLMAIVPLTMAASMMFDWFDENILGKRSNLREATAEDAIPGYGVINAPMATLERLGRYGAGGLLTEALNSALNVDDARGGMSADSRILLFSQLKNVKDLIGNLWQVGPGNANYVGMMRPLAQFMGLGGILQYQQIANKQLGLSNEEAGVNSRINVANYLRAAGRDLDLDVRLSRGPSSLPNEVTPYLQNMELAAYLDNVNMFRESYRRAVTAYHNLHPDEPDAARQVIRSFQSRHPLKRVFTSMPSERNYRAILDDLNPTGREAVVGGVRQFNRYLLLLGARPVDAKEEDVTSGQQLRRLVMSNEAIREAQAMAAQASYMSGL